MTGQIVAQGQRAAAAAGRVAEVLGTDPQIVDHPQPRKLPAAQARTGARAGALGEVRFESVSFGYAAGGGSVLDDLDLVVEPGASVALVGATGSGKTTVARLIPRFYDVDSGASASTASTCATFAFTTCVVRWASSSRTRSSSTTPSRANIAFADPDAPDAAVERAARLAGAHEFVTDLPDGYESLIGERGFSLSGGQRQRIAIARAILADPRVLILDDATSAVDPTKEHEIRDALAEVMRGRTTIVIAHRPATVALADRVVLLDRGKVVAEGTHDALLGESERYRAVLAAGEDERWATAVGGA